jgi:hypothetical protein
LNDFGLIAMSRDTRAEHGLFPQATGQENRCVADIHEGSRDAATGIPWIRTDSSTDEGWLTDAGRLAITTSAA